MRLRPYRTVLSAILVVGALARPVPAQSLNVKCGGQGPTPAYGAATGQVGIWNPAGYSISGLLDLVGQPTTATVEHSGCDASSCFECSSDCGGLTPGTEDTALLGSWFNGDCYTDPGDTFVRGLAAGRYALHLYAYHACTPSSLTWFNVAVTGAGGSAFETNAQVGGVAWSGTWSGFPYHTELLTIASGQQLRIRNVSTGIYGGFSGFQLTKLDAIELSCAGDGSGIPCPCGNSGAPGHGCANSQNPAGGFLSGFGIASTATDTVVLQGSNMPNASCTYFQGTEIAPVHVYDGILCLSGTLVRLGSKINAGHTSRYPEVGDVPVSVRGQVPAFGGTYYYSVRYRNAAAFCTPDTANYTNAIAVTWAP